MSVAPMDERRRRTLRVSLVVDAEGAAALPDDAGIDASTPALAWNWTVASGAALDDAARRRVLAETRCGSRLGLAGRAIDAPDADAVADAPLIRPPLASRRKL